MEFPVYQGGVTVGVVALEKDGLYTVLSACCERFAAGVQRLWGVRGLRSGCLGVLAPEGGSLALRRRLSAHALPEPPESFLAGKESDGWLPWRGTLAQEQIEAGWTRPDTSALAVPFSEELPLAIYEKATELSPITIGDTLCLRIPVSQPPS